ncbi:MAG: Hpt domain-containing protein [Caldilineaceae bacterium]|nr:Hpt domain-containing protein [Caldilineaceae bacterium]
MSSQQKDHPPLDADTIRAYVVDACGGDGEIVSQMVIFFLGSTDDLIAQMKTGVEGNDFDSARRAAHSLKSSSRMFSAEALSILCAKAETVAEAVAETGKAEAFLSLLPAIEREVEWLKACLPQFCAEIVA